MTLETFDSRNDRSGQADRSGAKDEDTEDCSGSLQRLCGIGAGIHAPDDGHSVDQALWPDNTGDVLRRAEREPAIRKGIVRMQPRLRQVRQFVRLRPIPIGGEESIRVSVQSVVHRTSETSHG